MFDHYYKEVTYSRPEFLYFWGYYFFMNFIWMVFPGSKSTPSRVGAGSKELWEYWANDVG
jgi:hypothetical protein